MVDHDRDADDSARQKLGDDRLLSLLFDPAVIADPAPTYKLIREEMPYFQSSLGPVVLSRFEDCRALLRNDDFGKNRDGTGFTMADIDDAERAELSQLIRDRRQNSVSSMLFLNPPDHTRMRGLVSRAFTPRTVEKMRGSIGSLSDESVERMAEGGGGDAIDILGWVPVNVIGELVGIPRADWAWFRPTVTTAVESLELNANLATSKAAFAAFDEMSEYFKALVTERRADPTDDLISALIEVEESGDRLSEAELISTIILLFSAGMETTQNLIGNGLGCLFDNPDQLDRLWDNPELAASAVEETLRFDSPVQVDGRNAMIDGAELLGRQLPEAQAVITLLGAANRDPEQFTDPDTFDIGRNEGPPLSFASGIHYCLGANLARVEGAEVFRALIKRFASIEPAGDRVQRGRLTLRGYESVPMKVTPR